MVRGVLAPRSALPLMARALRHVLLLLVLPIRIEHAAFPRRPPCTATGSAYGLHKLLEPQNLALEHCKQQKWAGGGTCRPRSTCEAQPHMCPWHSISRSTSTHAQMQHAHVPRSPQMLTNSHSSTFSLHTHLTLQNRTCARARAHAYRRDLSVEPRATPPRARVAAHDRPETRRRSPPRPPRLPFPCVLPSRRGIRRSREIIRALSSGSFSWSSDCDFRNSWIFLLFPSHFYYQPP